MSKLLDSHILNKGKLIVLHLDTCRSFMDLLELNKGIKKKNLNKLIIASLSLSSSSHFLFTFLLHGSSNNFSLNFVPFYSLKAIPHPLETYRRIHINHLWPHHSSLIPVSPTSYFILHHKPQKLLHRKYIQKPTCFSPSSSLFHHISTNILKIFAFITITALTTIAKLHNMSRHWESLFKPTLSPASTLVYTWTMKFVYHPEPWENEIIVSYHQQPKFKTINFYD